MMTSAKLTYTVFRQGEEITFESAFESSQDALGYLNELVTDGKVNSSFAKDLSWKGMNGRLSPKQWAWVHKLATDYKAKAAGSYGNDAIQGLDLSIVVEMMDRAAEAQKRNPRIKLECEIGPVVLTRAGDRSKQPGTINITDGRPFGENTWYGRVLRNGDVQPSYSWQSEIASLLAELAAAPEKVAGQHGIATGECCFCARALSTAESRSVGYGPICANKYGLPWGDTSVADAADEEARR